WNGEYPTVRSRDRPAVTWASVRHMTRFDTASIEELGSSKSSTGGLPVGAFSRHVSILRRERWPTKERNRKAQFALVAAGEFIGKTVFIRPELCSRHDEVHILFDS